MTAWVLGRILHLLHPVMPFITEELWRNLAGETAGMLISAPWPEFAGEADRAAAAEMEWVVAAISAIRAARAEVNVPPAARAPLLVRDADPAATQRLARHRDHFVRLARVERIDRAASLPAGAVQIVVEGATLILPLGEIVDLGREKARLVKEIGRLDGEIAKIARQARQPAIPRQGKTRGGRRPARARSRRAAATATASKRPMNGSRRSESGSVARLSRSSFRAPSPRAGSR